MEFISAHRITRLFAQTTTAVAERRRNSGGTTFGEGNGTGETRPVETEDIALVQFETDGGAIGSVVVSQVSPGRKNRLWIELDGAQEALVFDQEHPEALWCGRREAATIIRRDPEWLSPPAARFASLPGGHPQGYASCFDAFVADVYVAIRTGALPDGMPTFADGLRAAEITDAVMTSASEGGWVEVAEAGVRT
jgi:predicted dehydrogenase